MYVFTKFGKLYQAWRERGTQGFIRFVYDRLRFRVQQRLTYEQWIARQQLTTLQIKQAQQQIAQWSLRPTFSVILPVYNVEAAWLKRAIDSVRNQIYPNWELCIADDASSAPHIKPLLTHYSKLDPRIKVVFRAENGNIVAASNSALELATGDYIALLDHDDELAIDALYENARLINQHPDADFIYSDEDKINPKGVRSDPFFKPDWSPDYFHSCMYTCHLGVYRTRLIRDIGGFRSGFDGSQDYDLVLRVVEKTKQIYHIPKVLYHWRIIPASVTSGAAAKPWAYEAAVRALTDMVNRSPFPGRVEPGPRAGFHRIRRDLTGTPKISIVIPSGGAMLDTPTGPICLLEQCIRSIRDRSTYRNFEIVLVDGYDVPDQVLTAIAGDDLTLVRCADPFNFSQRINLGAEAATGAILLLLNDDVEVKTPDWLESMLEFSQQPEIGAVGAKLFFANGTIQHVGVMVLGGNAGHAYRGIDGEHPGYFLSNLVNRNYLVVTAACLMMRRAVFFELGRMDETFPLNYNDVDLCLKAHQAGYRNVVTPYAQLIHYESASRAPGLRPKEWDHLNTKWKAYFEQLNYHDPYYNPNLSAHDGVMFEL
ncbi:MAG: glycosyltransferase [Leptolyngbyaceae cyanobacterium bins.349]|nr:glycosyltransferase [Leptolyngbyaceae cyanobacterium bins.349]